jgi:molybdate transport system substrate-binding protein
MSPRLLILWTAFLIALSPSARAMEGTVTIFAAASTQAALDALAPALTDEGAAVRLVYAASSTLAKQIAAGAPADIFISANVAWMDDLDTKGRLVEGTRIVVATNRLVLIAPVKGGVPSPQPQASLQRDDPLLQGHDDGRLAMADPDHVPAGLYAREALTNLGLWDDVENRLARTQNVTGALLQVARGETPLGIVYASDMARSPDVRAIAFVPLSSHAPITYPAAIIRGHDTPAVRWVFERLNSEAAHRAFSAAGFGAVP